MGGGPLYNYGEANKYPLFAQILKWISVIVGSIIILILIKNSIWGGMEEDKLIFLKVFSFSLICIFSFTTNYRYNSFIKYIINFVILLSLILIYTLWIDINFFNLKFLLTAFLIALFSQLSTFLIFKIYSNLKIEFNNNPKLKVSDNLLSLIDQFIVNQQLPYLSLPVGALIAYILSRFIDIQINTIAFYISSILLVNAFWLLVSQYWTIQMISRPFLIKNFETSFSSEMELEVGKIRTTKSFPRISIVQSENAPKEESDKNSKFEMAIIFSKIRRFFTSFAIYNSISILFYIYIVYYLINEDKIPSQYIYIIIFFCFLMIQLPYVIGQFKINSYILSDYTGHEKEKIKEDLFKFSPLVPKSYLLKAITLSGTFGGIMYYLLNELLKDLF